MAVSILATVTRALYEEGKRVASYYFGPTYPSAAMEQGKTVLITGCDRGFGEGVALELHKKGWKVFATCYSEEAVRNYKNMNSENMISFKLDVANAEDIEQAASFVAEQCPHGLDCLVNNAGIYSGFFIDWTTMEQLRKTFEINTFGMVAMCKAQLPNLRKAQGRIVNISSIAAELANVGYGAYCASKHANNALSVAMRQEFAIWGVEVVLIQPSFTKTGLITNVLTSFEKDWENLPPGKKELYGEAFKQKMQYTLTNLMDPLLQPPEKVISTIAHVCRTRIPKENYYITADSFLLHIFFMIIPWAIIDWVVRLLFQLADAVPPSAPKKYKNYPIPPSTFATKSSTRNGSKAD